MGTLMVTCVIQRRKDVAVRIFHTLATSMQHMPSPISTRGRRNLALDRSRLAAAQTSCLRYFLSVPSKHPPIRHLTMIHFLTEIVPHSRFVPT